MPGSDILSGIHRATPIAMVIRALRSSSFLQSTLVLGAFLFGSEGRSSHIIGGELYYDHLGGSLYQVTLKLYRDCSSTVLFDNAAPIGVFTGDGVFIYTQNLNFPGSQTVPVVLESPCLTLPPNVCVETTSYTGVFDLPSSPTGYQLAYQRCCRTSQIVNLPDPGSLGLTCTISKAPSAFPLAGSTRKSMPGANRFPSMLTLMLSGKLFTLNWKGWK